MAIQRKMAIIIVVIAAFLATTLTAGYYFWIRPSQIDTSWVETVNNMLQGVNPYPNDTDPSLVTIAYCRVYLYENGSSDLIEIDLGGPNSVSRNLNTLMTKLDVRLGEVSNPLLDRVLIDDKVIEIAYRLSTLKFGGQQRFWVGYFVLKDNLNVGLLGKVITGEVGKPGYSLWALSK